MEIIIYTMFYGIALIAHGLALIYGLAILKQGEADFTQSNIKTLLHNRIEQKYITVLIGVFSNILFIPTMSLYMLGDSYHVIGYLNLSFSLWHGLAGIITLAWHYIAYQDIVGGGVNRNGR